MQKIPFMVHDTPYYLIGNDIIKLNLRFLKDFQPEYFHETSKVLFSSFQTSKNKKEKNYLASQIKTLYHQAVETFFAYLFGSLQAPLCIIAWLQLYRIKSLREFVEIINTDTSFPYFKISLKKYSWFQLSKQFNFFKHEDEQIHNNIINGYAKFWRKIADDIINEDKYVEFNQIKHGFRIKPGGFSLYIQEEVKKGKNNNPIIPVLSGEFGSTIYKPEFYISNDKRTNILSLSTISNNWNIDFYIKSLELLEYSLKNIKSFLIGLVSNTLNEQLFYFPDDINLFDEVNASSNPISSSKLNNNFENLDLTDFNKSDVKKSYEEKIFIFDKLEIEE